jgi:nicotinamidase-related amidase
MRDDAARQAPYEAGRTALLFVDMQRIFLIPGLDPSHPGDANDYFYRRVRSTVVPNARRLAESARRAGVEVMFTIIESLTRDGRDRSLDHKLSGILVPRGHPDSAVIDDLAPGDDEIVLPKTSSGVFNSTNIDYVLRNLGIRMLVIAGVVTDQCVDMAVRDAADRGYLVTLVEDACATYSEERHRAALRAFGGYCWVADATTVAARFGSMKR